jgi:hypothetical protein
MTREENVQRNYCFLSALAELMAGDPDARIMTLIPKAMALADRKLERVRPVLANEDNDEY